jgi:hypothetical protein
MIIGIAGKSKSGKDTLADFFVQKGFVKVAFADEPKRICQSLWGWDSNTLWGESSLRNQPDPKVVKADGMPLTPRHALQSLGTEWGRSCDPDVWIRYLLRVIATLQQGGWSYTQEGGLKHDPSGTPVFKGAVVTDIRYVSELASLSSTSLPSFRVRIHRGSSSQSSGTTEAWRGHSSETELDQIPDSAFTHVIHNNSTLEDFHRQCEELVSKYAV